MYRILDLDNCIADDEWRIPLIDWAAPNKFQRYHRYHCLSAWDKCVNAQLFAINYRIIIFTGRQELYRPMTEEWLKRHGVPFHQLFMRGDDDDRSSVEVKDEMLDRLLMFQLRQNDIECAFDDRADIVQMYRAAGVRAVQIMAHGVDAYLNPTTGAVHA